MDGFRGGVVLDAELLKLELPAAFYKARYPQVAVRGKKDNRQHYNAYDDSTNYIYHGSSLLAPESCIV